MEKAEAAVKRNDRINYLNLVPARKPGVDFRTDEKGLVVLALENKGFFNRAAQKLFHRPPVSYVHLDELGSFVWLQIDREHTIGAIASLVHSHFGEKAEPLYPRLIQYFKNLELSGLITLPPVSDRK